MRKYRDYLFFRVSGEWESLKVPNFFAASEVARHRPHSDVFQRVYKGETAYVRGTVYNGPCWLQIAGDDGVAVYDDPRRVRPQEFWAAAKIAAA